jgi:hypothetical protein
MARGTFPGGSLEDRRDVAAFAIHIPMGALERPAGREMIEPGAGSRLSVDLSKGEAETFEACDEKHPEQAFSAGAHG